MLDQIRQMSYLDGPTAAQAMERLIQEGIQPLQKGMQQRDQAYAQLYKQHRALQDTVGNDQGKQKKTWNLDSRN